MIRPSVTNNAAIAMIRWNDVMGRPSQAPNRVRGSAVVAFAVVFSAEASGVPSAAWSPLTPRRSSRASVFFTLQLPLAHGGRERVAAVPVAGELVKGGAGRCQQHRIAGLSQVSGGGHGSVHDASADSLVRYGNHVCHRRNRRLSSRMHIDILACHNLYDGHIR